MHSEDALTGSCSSRLSLTDTTHWFEHTD